jgi:hypothetical protein
MLNIRNFSSIIEIATFLPFTRASELTSSRPKSGTNRHRMFTGILSARQKKSPRQAREIRDGPTVRSLLHYSPSFSSKMMGAAGLKGPSAATAFARQRLAAVPRYTRSVGHLWDTPGKAPRTD